MNCVGESNKTVYRDDVSVLHFDFLDSAVSLLAFWLRSSLIHVFCKFLDKVWMAPKLV